ncbi:MAG: hypothetical protein Q4E70_01295 [Candidatus Saccharibacteria bacterium]|nr:hypothetical protein [Candidatus Saccharibacteria bacterium]
MMRRLRENFFEDSDDDIFVNDYDEDDIYEDDDDYDGHSDRNIHGIIEDLKGDLCFFSFIFVIVSVFVGGIYLIGRFVMYPFVKKIVEDWD